MIRALWPQAVAAVLAWIVGFNVLRHLAARAVEREGRRGTYLEIMQAGAWREGESTTARRWRNAAIAWFLLVPLLVVAGLASYAARR